ncbi:hypothetical protein BDB01DRAFT_832384 [Pilobolus umbonatus]|nr:hypothetical protein BDB01DRAFT_832384 [Pilobolus umbonatus]
MDTCSTVKCDSLFLNSVTILQIYPSSISIAVITVAIVNEVVYVFKTSMEFLEPGKKCSGQKVNIHNLIHGSILFLLPPNFLVFLMFWSCCAVLFLFNTLQSLTSMLILRLIRPSKWVYERKRPTWPVLL